jgi:hypothetical protein
MQTRVPQVSILSVFATRGILTSITGKEARSTFGVAVQRCGYALRKLQRGLNSTET